MPTLTPGILDRAVLAETNSGSSPCTSLKRHAGSVHQQPQTAKGIRLGKETMVFIFHIPAIINTFCFHFVLLFNINFE